MIELSASRCSQARACPPSIRTDGIQVVTGDLPAAGQALHHLLYCGIAYHQHLEVATAAAIFGADPEELERLTNQAWRAWSAIRHWFGDSPQCEVFLEHQFGPVHLTGHIDVLGLAPMQRQIRIADWKSSWTEESHEDQLRAYALLALETYPDYDEVWAAVIRPRQGTYDAQVYRREGLKLWMDGLIERLTGRGSEQYHVGEQCLRCPRAATCPAVTALVRQPETVLSLVSFPGSPSEAERCQVVYENIRVLENACEATRKALKAKVAAAGGRIGNLVVTEEARETIRWTKESQNIMVDEALADDWPKVLAIKKTELKKAVMDLAERGQKTAAWESLQERLREAGAVETTYFSKLELRRSHATETAIEGGANPGTVIGHANPGQGA